MQGPSSDTFDHGSPPRAAGGQSVADSASGSGGSDAEERQDVGENGSRKRRKKSLKISCELCKARKVKCDRAEPSCGWCSRNNRVCVYNERRRPGYRASYGERDELEGKINRVEALLQVLGRRLEEHISDHTPDHHGTVRSLTSDAIISPSQANTGPSFPQTVSPVATGSVAVPTLGAESRWSDPRNPHNHTVSSVESTAPGSEARWTNSTGYDRLQQELRAPEPMSIQSVVEDGPSAAYRPLQSESDLPPYDLSYTLVDLYFKHVNPWCPILDRAATFTALFQSVGTLEAADTTLLHAIIATTMRFSEDTRLTPESRAQYHTVSKAKVQQYGLSHANVRSLQSLVILAVDVLGNSSGPEGWGLLALVAQNVTRLGLGTERDVYLASPTYASIR